MTDEKQMIYTLEMKQKDSESRLKLSGDKEYIISVLLGDVDYKFWHKLSRPDGEYIVLHVNDLYDDYKEYNQKYRGTREMAVRCASYFFQTNPGEEYMIVRYIDSFLIEDKNDS